jgi:hypothetical protein
MPECTPLSVPVAQHIVNRVGEGGQPPEIGIEHIVVGFDSLLNVIDTEYLQPIADFGRGSAFKLVQAFYGGGKTTFLNAVRDMAWSRGLCTATVGLSPEECPFDNAQLTYQAVARETCWPPEDPTVAPARGLDNTLRLAVEKLQAGMSDGDLLDWLDTSFRRTPVDALSYRKAVYQYVRAIVQKDMEMEELAAAWLRGDLLNGKERAELGVRENIGKDNGFRMLRSLCQVLRGLGGAGLLLCFDEMDRNLSLPPRRRRAVADNLREMIDLCGREALPGLLVLYAVPPDFMRHVVTEYPALQQRLEGSRSLSTRSPQAAVIDLEALEMGNQALLEKMGQKLLHVFSVARSADFDTAIQHKNLEILAKEILSGSFEVAHRRQFTKAVIEMLHQQSHTEGLITEAELDVLVCREAEVISLSGGEEW